MSPSDSQFRRAPDPLSEGQGEDAVRIASAVETERPLRMIRAPRLSRREAAAFLTENGYPVTVSSLASLAHKGDGPIYDHFGKRTFYRANDLLAWAEGRLTPNRVKAQEELKLDPNNKAGLTRREAAMFLTENGYPISFHTLANLACKGGGPTHKYFGRRTFYKPNELLDWAKSRLSSECQDQGFNPRRHVA